MYICRLFQLKSGLSMMLISKYSTIWARFLNHSSSLNLSCNSLLFPINYSLWKAIGWSTTFCKVCILERATELHPAALSAFPMSTITWGNVCPWDLWLAIACRHQSGSCCLDKHCPSLSHSNKCGGMETDWQFAERLGLCSVGTVQVLHRAG